MNTDPSTNVVVFEVRRPEGLMTFPAAGRAEDDSCVQRAWASLSARENTAPIDVTRIYSEWQPSASDMSFLEASFPKATLSYSFERPEPDGWPAAFKRVAQEILASQQARSQQEQGGPAESPPSPSDRNR
ncbi:hypothetical protein PGB34_16345 [Xenophilus arseniciresistens]|uniref:Uncharacterized protein n=1 Tax=Xenophilus arseniciresistens TaxID=1283306 RepID=A0AAE3T1F6_9BURK|nr:hypothetical protein [Xenophilus arseniciresistens]MDA7417936.1 hypothetical protein [Xenophilus arseniciresistens]